MGLLKRIYWLIALQFSLDPWRIICAFRSLPHYVADWYRFRKGYRGRMLLRPCLHDRHAEGGAIGDEYFLQDLHVARKVFQKNPDVHVDIGSRIDGFVAHVASFRSIELLDIRPVRSAPPGITFRQVDMMSSDALRLADYCDSISCLHALEHFGLGRYGDPISPYGYRTGFSNIVNMLKKGGVFYLSLPVGVERVEFNAHRVFSPYTIMQLAAESKMVLQEFSWICGGELLHSTNFHRDMQRLSETEYALGIFSFTRQ